MWRLSSRYLYNAKLLRLYKLVINKAKITILMTIIAQINYHCKGYAKLWNNTLKISSKNRNKMK